ncbi:hypothetical protein [Spirochaeta dissipatitropha]
MKEFGRRLLSFLFVLSLVFVLVACDSTGITTELPADTESESNSEETAELSLIELYEWTIADYKNTADGWSDVEDTDPVGLLQDDGVITFNIKQNRNVELAIFNLADEDAVDLGAYSGFELIFEHPVPGEGLQYTVYFGDLDSGYITDTEEDFKDVWFEQNQNITINFSDYDMDTENIIKIIVQVYNQQAYDADGFRITKAELIPID